MCFCACRLCVLRIDFRPNAPRVSQSRRYFVRSCPRKGELSRAFGRGQHCRAGMCPLWPWISYPGHSRSNSQAPSGLAFYGFKQTITCKERKWLEGAPLLGTHWAHQLQNVNTCGICAELPFPWGSYKENFCPALSGSRGFVFSPGITQCIFTAACLSQCPVCDELVENDLHPQAIFHWTNCAMLWKKLLSDPRGNPWKPWNSDVFSSGTG